MNSNNDRVYKISIKHTKLTNQWQRIFLSPINSCILMLKKMSFTYATSLNKAAFLIIFKNDISLYRETDQFISITHCYLISCNICIYGKTAIYYIYILYT